MSSELVLSTAQHPRQTPGDLANDCHALLIQQKLTWELLRTNYANLEQVETRSMEFDQCTVRLQYNPHRIVSSAAKVDDKTIRERKCFLCPGHLPREQRALPFDDGYLILINPFPIFPEHLTIPHREHRPQLIGDAFGTMLDLTRAIGSRYTVFYNGPRCGASAPDHVHFQAGIRHLMPLEHELTRLKATTARALSAKEVEVHAISDGLRRFITIESPSADALQAAFDSYYAAHQTITASTDEPMLNILSLWTGDRWQIILFPRAKHRPDMFFAEGDSKYLLSPASVDLGGLLVVPVEKDFRRLTPDLVRQMFAEVCLSDQAFTTLASELQRRL